MNRRAWFLSPLFMTLKVCGAIPLAAHTPTPTTHRLEATPGTVAYGYYWSEAKPALRTASGDITSRSTRS